MKKFIAFFGIALMLLIFASCGGASTVANWSGSNMDSDLQDNSWTVTADRVNGNITRQDVDFSAENLDMLHVSSMNTDGEVILTLIQGDIEIPVDLTGGTEGFLISGDLQPGNIRLRLDFDNATDVRVTVRWQGAGLFFN